MEEASHRGPHSVGFRVYDMCRTGKSSELESRFLVAWAGTEEWGVNDGDGFPFGLAEKLGN